MPNQQTVPSPWLVGLLPWVVDLLFKTSFLNSILGAALWGLLLVVYFAAAKLKDPKLKRNLNYALGLLALLWITGWLEALIYPIENPLQPAASLFFLHGTFLVAAAGMLVLVLGGAIAGLVLEKKLFLPRESGSKKGPSAEGLMNLCSWSLSLARRFWLLGTLLAIIAVAVQIAHNHESWLAEFSRWLTDPSVWCVLSLAGVLFASKYFLDNRLRLKTLFRAYLMLSVAALITVSVVVYVTNSKNGHVQQEFLR